MMRLNQTEIVKLLGFTAVSIYEGCAKDRLEYSFDSTGKREVEIVEIMKAALKGKLKPRFQTKKVIISKLSEILDDDNLTTNEQNLTRQVYEMYKNEGGEDFNKSVYTRLSKLLGFPKTTLYGAVKDGRINCTIDSQTGHVELTIADILKAVLNNDLRPSYKNRVRIVSCLEDLLKTDKVNADEVKMIRRIILRYSGSNVECDPLPQNLTTMRQLSQLTSINYSTIKKWVQTGKLEVIKVDSCYVLNGERIDSRTNVIRFTDFFTTVISHAKLFKNVSRIREVEKDCIEQAKKIGRYSSQWAKLAEVLGDRAKHLEGG